MNPDHDLTDRLRELCFGSLYHSNEPLDFLAEARKAFDAPDEPIHELLGHIASACRSPEQLAQLTAVAMLPQIQRLIHGAAGVSLDDDDELLYPANMQRTLLCLEAPLYSKIRALCAEDYRACLDEATRIFLLQPARTERAIHCVLAAQAFCSDPASLERFLLAQAQCDFVYARTAAPYRYMSFIFLEAANCPALDGASRSAAEAEWKRHPFGPIPGFGLLGRRIGPADEFLGQRSIFEQTLARHPYSETDLQYLHHTLRSLAGQAERAESSAEIERLRLLLCACDTRRLEEALTLQKSLPLFATCRNLLGIFERRSRGEPESAPRIEFLMLEFYESLFPESFANDYLYLIRALIDADRRHGRICAPDREPHYAFASAALSRALRLNSLEAVLDINAERLSPAEQQAAMERRIAAARAFRPALRSAFEKQSIARACPGLPCAQPLGEARTL